MTTDNSSPLPADTSVSDLPSPATDAQPPQDAQSPQAMPEQSAALTPAEGSAAADSAPEATVPEVASGATDSGATESGATVGESVSPASSETAPSLSDASSSDPSPSNAPSGDAGESVESSAASEPTATEPVATPVAEITPSAPEAEPGSAEPPPEKTRRRVQLKPTYSPDIAKPVPSIVPPTPPAVAAPVAAATAASDQSQPSPSTDEPSAAGESSDGAPPQAADQTDATTGDRPAAEETAADKPADGTEGASAPPPRPPAADPVALPPKNEQLDADIEAELNAALSGDTGDVPDADDAANEVADLDKVAEAITVPDDEDVTRGARLSGTVQSIHGDDMFVDFGLRMPGVLSRRQYGLRKQPMQGEAITVIVARIDEKEGLIHVNLPSGASRVRGNWDELSVDQIVECQVNQTNKGGLEVSVGSLRGFMPASQVELGYVADLNVYVGQKLRAQITEVNPKRRKLVLSRRSLLEAEREVTEKDFFEKVAPGQTYQGRVKTIKDYGAFVDIGGVDGLLHVGQISWSRINHPSDVLTQGQEIEVKVLSVDTEKKKIGLGMRQLSANPWQTAEEKYPSGMVVKGKVTRIESFGGFIELEPGIEGLVHISQLDHQRIKTVHEVLKVGQELDVQVLEVDPSRKRISLSVKALKEKPEEAPEPDGPPVQRVDPESLKGGIGDPTGGQLFGDPGKFGR